MAVEVRKVEGLEHKDKIDKGFNFFNGNFKR